MPGFPRGASRRPLSSISFMEKEIAATGPSSENAGERADLYRIG